MGELDLRPPGGPRLTDSSPALVGGPRWWEPLTTRWGWFLICVFIGLAAGVVELFKPSSQYAPTQKAATESAETERAKAEAALRPSLERFYNNSSNDAAHREVIRAVENYRRLFDSANFNNIALKDPERFPVTLAEEQEKRRREDVALATEARFAELPRGSIARRIAFVEALVRDRVVSVQYVKGILGWDKNNIPRERDAVDPLRMFASQIDAAIAAKTYRNSFSAAAYEVRLRDKLPRFSTGDPIQSLRPFLFYKECKPGRGITDSDIQACRQAVESYDNYMASIDGGDKWSKDANCKGGILECDEPRLQSWTRQKKEWAQQLIKLMQMRDAPTAYVEGAFEAFLRK